ncbi:FliH/SctL family protein [Colwellia sp. MEBiC06753]
MQANREVLKVPSFTPKVVNDDQLKTSEFDVLKDIESRLELLDSEQAKSLLSRIFEKDIKQILEQETVLAKQSGYQDGLTQAQQEAETQRLTMKRELETSQQNLSELIEQIKQLKPQIMIESEQQVVAVIEKCLFKILAVKLNEPELVMQQLNSVMQDFVVENGLTIELPSQFYQTYLDNKERVSCSDGVQIKENPSLTNGSIVVNTPLGQLASNVEDNIKLCLSALGQQE